MAEPGHASLREAPRIGPAPRTDCAPILVEGRNVWRVETARRAAVLVDAAACFGAMREAMKKARRSIMIVGWDIDSRTPLVGPDGAHDDLPPTLGAFLSALVKRNPELSIKLLLWDYSMLYALEREMLPELALGWNTPRQVEICLDDTIPFGSSHHQKIVVIDDALAFNGGIDLTVRRWDRPDHLPDNPARVDPAGKPYAPFHDVQMMVDGPAAAALGDLVRARWAHSACECLEPPTAENDPWPADVEPHFRDVAIGIARTKPEQPEEREVREIEALFRDMIAAAERTIYIENQFLTCLTLADCLAERLREVPALEVLIVAPKTHHTWLEHRTMLAGRIRFMEKLREAGVLDRVRLVYPYVETGGRSAEVMVHAKVTVVDDRLLRIGSANLANRSMGTDTECDLVIEAEDRRTRATVTRIRDGLISEHLGLSAGDIADAVSNHGALLAAVDAISRKGSSRRLVPIDDGRIPDEEIQAIETIADPGRPIAPPRLLAEVAAPRVRRQWPKFLLKTVGVILVFMLFVGLWRWTPLAEWTRPETITASLAALARAPWGPALVILVFIVGGFVAFPVTLLIAATAAAFGIWPGLAYAAGGSLASAFLTYLIGRRFGTDGLRGFAGPRINRIGERIADQGIVAVTAARLLPVAPFTLVNLVAGAMRIRLSDYLIGTALGLAPGIALMSALGRQASSVLQRPDAADVALLAGLFLLWYALSLGLQRLLARRGRRHS